MQQEVYNYFNPRPFMTCPMYGKSITSCYSSIRAHLKQHKEIPSEHINPIASLVTNRKGCNSFLLDQPEEAQTFITDFVGKVKEQQQAYREVKANKTHFYARPSKHNSVITF